MTIYTKKYANWSEPRYDEATTQELMDELLKRQQSTRDLLASKDARIGDLETVNAHLHLALDGAEIDRRVDDATIDNLQTSNKRLIAEIDRLQEELDAVYNDIDRLTEDCLCLENDVADASASAAYWRDLYYRAVSSL